MGSEEARRFLGVVSQVFGSVKITPSTVSLWASCLDDVAYDLAVRALEKHCREDRYPPSPGALREIIYGRWESVGEPVRDLWDRVILGRDGVPRMSWERVRVGGMIEEQKERLLVEPEQGRLT